MKAFLATCTALALTTASFGSAPADDLAAAARKLAEAPNYGWIRTTEIVNSQFPVVPIEGWTEKGGFTVTSVTFNDNTFQSVTKDGKTVSQGQGGVWMTAEEVRALFAARGGEGAGKAGGRGRGGFGFGMFGGAQTAPAEEAVRLADRISDAKIVDNAIVGALSAADIAALLTFGGRGGTTPPAPRNASIKASFWLKEGALVRYAVTIKGTFSLPSGEQRDFERITTTEFKEVGTTKVNVPAEAKAKLGL